MDKATKEGWGSRLTSRTYREKECCEDMDRAAGDAFEQPNALVHYSETEGYGLLIRGDSELWVRIDFCPWCGHQLDNRSPDG